MGEWPSIGLTSEADKNALRLICGDEHLLNCAPMSGTCAGNLTFRPALFYKTQDS